MTHTDIPNIVAALSDFYAPDEIDAWLDAPQALLNGRDRSVAGRGLPVNPRRSEGPAALRHDYGRIADPRVAVDPITAERRIQADCRARLAALREKPWTAGSQDIPDIRIRFRESLAREWAMAMAAE